MGRRSSTGNFDCESFWSLTLYALDLSPQMRVCVPDLENMKTWRPPKAEKL